jgi:putative ABC transport system permease protein
VRSGCARGRRGHCSRRSASRSAWPRCSPWWASPASGRADLRRALDDLGTNLLTVTGADNDPSGDGRLPGTATSHDRADRAGPERGRGRQAAGRRPRVPQRPRPAHETNGILVYATDLGLPATVGATLAHGAWLNAATATYPGVVLGADAARRLGVVRAGPGVLVQLGDERFAVIGILDPLPLAPELDGAALVGTTAAQRYLGGGSRPTTVYLRAVDEQVTAVRDVLAATANPDAPYLVAVSRPSDALAAKLATERALNSLVLGPRRGRARRRRCRRRQHHGDLRPGTADRDRAAPRPGATGATSACSSSPSRCC